MPRLSRWNADRARNAAAGRWAVRAADVHALREAQLHLAICPVCDFVDPSPIPSTESTVASLLETPHAPCLLLPASPCR